jgi:hypothetical protein
MPLKEYTSGFIDMYDPDIQTLELFSQNTNFAYSPNRNDGGRLFYKVWLHRNRLPTDFNSPV